MIGLLPYALALRSFVTARLRAIGTDANVADNAAGSALAVAILRAASGRDSIRADRLLAELPPVELPLPTLPVFPERFAAVRRERELLARVVYSWQVAAVLSAPNTGLLVELGADQRVRPRYPRRRGSGYEVDFRSVRAEVPWALWTHQEEESLGQRDLRDGLVERYGSWGSVLYHRILVEVLDGAMPEGSVSLFGIFGGDTPFFRVVAPLSKRLLTEGKLPRDIADRAALPLLEGWRRAIVIAPTPTGDSGILSVDYRVQTPLAVRTSLSLPMLEPRPSQER